MRSIEQINKIKQTITDPYSIENFLTTDEIDYLVSIFDKIDDRDILQAEKIYKNTGPVTIDLKFFINDPVVIRILERLKLKIGNFEITAALFFKTNYPHVIHNDDTYELPNEVYKAITLPLKLYGMSTDYPSLCFFNQFYFHGPAKFFLNDKNIPTYYNEQKYDYSNVDLLGNEDIDHDLYIKYFTHLKKSWLKGLTLHSVKTWIPGSAIIFDSVRLHCASDFRNQGITEKLGISIFTKKEL
jgi:hypothetical protein